MTVNPFGDKAAEFTETRRGCITEISRKNLVRRFNRIESDLKRLKEDGRIKTLSPAKLTEDEVKEFIVYRKAKKVSASDVNHDISALKQLCTWCGNTAVQNCLMKNDGLKPKSKQHIRLEPLSDDCYRRILEVYNSETFDRNSLARIRPYVMVLTYICTGARNKELRFATIDDLDVAEWTIHFEHVKGEDTYGQPRDVPVPEVLQPILENFLKVRHDWCISHRIDPDEVKPLFFRLDSGHDFLSANTIRCIKQRVEKDIGHKFELRDCRRAFGQHYKDNDVELEDVSKLMGHNSTRTTELYYCGKRQSEVIRNVRGKW